MNEPVKPSNLASAIAFCKSAPVLPAFSKACKPKLVASYVNAENIFGASPYSFVYASTNAVKSSLALTVV